MSVGGQGDEEQRSRGEWTETDEKDGEGRDV